MVAIRLDVLVRKVLQDARERMEERAGAVVEAAPEFAARHRGGDELRAGGQGLIGTAPRGCRNHDQPQCEGRTQRLGLQPKERFRSKEKLPLTHQGAGTGSSE